MAIFHVIDNSYPDSYIETAKLIPNALNTCYFLLLGYFQDKYKGLFTGTVKITSLSAVPLIFILYWRHVWTTP